MRTEPRGEGRGWGCHGGSLHLPSHDFLESTSRCPFFLHTSFPLLETHMRLIRPILQIMELKLIDVKYHVQVPKGNMG